MSLRESIVTYYLLFNKMLMLYIHENWKHLLDLWNWYQWFEHILNFGIVVNVFNQEAS